MKEETTEKKCSESGRRGHGEEEVRGVGALKISTVVLFGVVVFGEEVFADPHRPQVKDLSSGNGFDNGRSNDETKRCAEVV
ncbi:hypothetical protein YC2023_016363 [Brassica napus]